MTFCADFQTAHVGLLVTTFTSFKREKLPQIVALSPDCPGYLNCAMRMNVPGIESFISNALATGSTSCTVSKKRATRFRNQT